MTSQNLLMTGSKYKGRIVTEFSRDIWNKIEGYTGEILAYCYGTTFTHHASVFHLKEINQTFKMHMMGDKEEISIYVDEAKFSPQGEIRIAILSVKDLLDYGHSIMTELNTYDVLFSSCQQFNNELMKPFKAFLHIF